MIVSVRVTTGPQNIPEIGQVIIHNTGVKTGASREWTEYDVYVNGEAFEKVFHKREDGAVVLLSKVFSKLEDYGIEF